MMNDTIKKIVVFGAVFSAIGAIVLFGSDGEQTLVSDSNKSIHKMTAKGGYYPRSITIDANKSSILRVHTENTYDCSGAISIPGLDVNVILPPSGDTDIEIPALKPGTILAGGCTSSTYGFEIKVL